MDIWRLRLNDLPMPGTPENLLVAELAAEFSRRKPMRTGSLITTIYGDVVAPRGGTLWLGSLLPLLHTFGINDSQARTAMSRLVMISGCPLIE